MRGTLILLMLLTLGCGSSAKRASESAATGADSKGALDDPAPKASRESDQPASISTESAAPSVESDPLGVYYVIATTLNVRSAPRTGQIVNKLYLQGLVTVTEVDGDWARITQAPYEPRWVSLKYLTRTKPELPEQEPIPESMRDPRIQESSIPKAGQYGLTQRDVEILWKGANWALRTGKCSCIDSADKSIYKSNTYYVHCCDASQNVFFTPEQIK